MTLDEIELLPGVTLEPVFKSRDEEEKFFRDFYDSVSSKLKENDRRRFESAMSAKYRYIN